MAAALVDAGNSSLPRSGSLFQAVVSWASQGIGGLSIEDFCVVPSDELRTFYGITSIPVPFQFDDPAITATP
jgi:hypothetical protein